MYKEYFERYRFVTIIVIALAVVASLVFDIPVLHDLLTGKGKSTSSLWTAATWLFATLTGSISTYFTAAWKYMGSDERKNKLFKKYYRQQLDALKEIKVEISVKKNDSIAS